MIKTGRNDHFEDYVCDVKNSPLYVKFVGKPNLAQHIANSPKLQSDLLDINIAWLEQG